MLNRFEEIDRKLMEIEEIKLTKESFRKKKFELKCEIDEKQNEVRRQISVVKKESRDVEKLKTISFASVLSTLKGDRNEKLTKEERELLDETMRLERLRGELEVLSDDYSYKKQKYDELEINNAEERLLLEEKEELLKNYSQEYKNLFEESRRKINLSKEQLIEIRQALNAGRGALSVLNTAQKHLDEANRLHNWDVWTQDNLFRTLRKHDSLNTANSYIAGSREKVRRYNEELKDVKFDVQVKNARTADVNFTTDFLFDNIFHNLNVRNTIETSINSTTSSKYMIQRTQNKLNHLEEKHMNIIKNEENQLRKNIKNAKINKIS